MTEWINLLVPYQEYLDLVHGDKTLAQVNTHVQLTMSDDRDAHWAVTDLRTGDTWVQAENRGGWRRSNSSDPQITVGRNPE